MKRQTREERQAEREKQNALFRAYGYHWKRTEELTSEQFGAARSLGDPEDDLPQWILLSPLEMPVNNTTILRWLGERGNSGEDVLQFIGEHGFTVLGKDEHHAWRIQTPSGKDVINLKQTLQAIERIRIDRAKYKSRVHKQKIKEDFELSATSLKEALDLYGEAQNDASAWGYSPYPHAKRLSDGTIEVTTYHFESEWHTDIYQDEAEVVDGLYSDGEGYWDPGKWVKP